MASNVVTVKHYRFRNDDGSETAATWLSPQDTNTSMVVAGNTNFRLRFVLELTAALSATADTWELNCAYNGGTPTLITSSSTYVQGVVSTHLTDGANTTNQLTVDAGFSYVTGAGVTNNVNAESQSISQTANTETEVEWSLVAIGSAISPGDTLTFTLVKQTGGAGTLTQYGSLITLTAGSTAAGRRRCFIGVE